MAGKYHIEFNARALRADLAARRITISGAARQIGVTRALLYHWLRGNPPSFGNLAKIMQLTKRRGIRRYLTITKRRPVS